MSQIITLLEDGWAGKLPSLGYLQTVAGLNDTGAAKLCGVASETYRRWRTDRTPPLYAFRLLSIMAGYMPWAGWEQWFFNPFDQTLNRPDLKDGFSPVQIAEFLFLRHRYQQKKASNSHNNHKLNKKNTPQTRIRVPYPIYRQAQGRALVPRACAPLSVPVPGHTGNPELTSQAVKEQRLRKETMVHQDSVNRQGIDYAK